MRSALSPTPDGDDPINKEELRQENLRGELNAYRELVEDGGRPSHHPSDFRRDILPQSDGRPDIFEYWSDICHGSECILQQQSWHWSKFRKYQDRKRQELFGFERYVDALKNYRTSKGLEGEILLSQRRQEQSHLDDWREYQVWELAKSDRVDKRMARATQDKEASQQRLLAAVHAGQPTERTRWIKEQGVDAYEARRGTAEIELRRHAVLLQWVAEQVSIVASETATSSDAITPKDVHKTNLAATRLGKRKRTANDSTCANKRRTKASVLDETEYHEEQFHRGDASEPQSMNELTKPAAKRSRQSNRSVKESATCNDQALVPNASWPQHAPPHYPDRTSEGQDPDMPASPEAHIVRLRVQPSRRAKDKATRASKRQQRQASPSSYAR